VSRAVYLRRAALADAFEEFITGDGTTGEVLAWHGVARN
jgi:hypothetical protein